MSPAQEIIRALPTLTNEELCKVERVLIQIYRERKVGIVFDDAYGVLTEEDLLASTAETFVEMDMAEARERIDRNNAHDS